MKGTLSLAVLLAVAAAVSGAATAVPGRIVGGEPTTIEAYPYIVQSEHLGAVSGVWSQSCAGNILTSLWVVSAAHCYAGVNFNVQSRRFRWGTSFRNEGGSISYVASVTNHESYNVVPRDGDIAMVRCATPFIWSDSVQPVAIVAQNSAVPDNHPVEHVGWGTTQSGGTTSYDVRHVTIYTVNRQMCRQRYAEAGPNYVISENMICAGLWEEGGKDACQGDSGGPMYFNNGDINILVGVVSWGIGCGHRDYPGVSTNVASYTNWIVNIAENSTYIH